MCVFGNKVAKAETPQLPVEYAAQRAPATQAAADAGQRAKDTLRSTASTILTGTNGVGAVDATGKKVLLGA
jgi:hypothetical protein